MILALQPNANFLTFLSSVLLICKIGNDHLPFCLHNRVGKIKRSIVHEHNFYTGELGVSEVLLLHLLLEDLLNQVVIWLSSVEYSLYGITIICEGIKDEQYCFYTYTELAGI